MGTDGLRGRGLFMTAKGRKVCKEWMAENGIKPYGERVRCFRRDVAKMNRANFALTVGIPLEDLLLIEDYHVECHHRHFKRIELLMIRLEDKSE